MALSATQHENDHAQRVAQQTITAAIPPAAAGATESRPVRRGALVAMCALISLAATGCGQKGPLFLPTQTPAEADASAKDKDKKPSESGKTSG